jgi:hypothetical protein
MRLELIRSGGIGGLSVRRSIDTSKLEAPKAQEVERLVEQLDLDDLSGRSPLRGEGADRFQYDLSVEAEGRQRRVTVAEAEGPAELQKLVAWVLEHADAGQ